MIVKFLLGVIAVLVLIILFGCVEPEPVRDYDTEIADLQGSIAIKEIALSNANTKIIELQESSEYLRKQGEVIKAREKDLQVVFNDLFTDASTCFYANYCLYNEVACVETLGHLYPGYSAIELHVMESDWCDGMYRDWEKYQDYDTSIGDE